jgi:hypothetical protein
MSIHNAPLPDEILEKICHHVACVYKDALPSRLAYECFMHIAILVAIRFAEEALFNQKYAAGSIGITVSNMGSDKLHKIIYYSVLSDMTNPSKFQQAFSNKAQIHTLPEHQQIVNDIILLGMVEQPL